MTSNLLQEFLAIEGRTQGHSFIMQTLLLDLHLILCSSAFTEFALSCLFLIIFIYQTEESRQMWVSSFPSQTVQTTSSMNQLKTSKSHWTEFFI